MLPQRKLIERVKETCQLDDRLRAAMMYGSFAKGGGDQYSDIEFALFFRDDDLETLDRRAWLEQIAPVHMYTVNIFGITTVIFEGLIRGEFHFYKQSEVEIVSAWKETDWFPSLESALVVDKDKVLTPHLQNLIGKPSNPITPQNLQRIVDSFLNWYVFGILVLARGEFLRALDLLSWVQRNLLWMIRAVEKKTENWPTPSRLAEKELPKTAYQRFLSCTGGARLQELRESYVNAWQYGRELIQTLSKRHGVVVSQDLIGEIEDYLTQLE